MGLFFTTLVSAESIGTFREGDDVTIYQTCNNCTYVNFTRVMRFDDQVILSNLAAVKDGTYYSSLIKAGNLTVLGEYTYCYEAGNTVESETGCLTFDVTFSGRPMTGAMGTVYAISMFFLIFLFILILLGIYSLPSRDTTDEDGSILQVSNLKHLRPVLWGACWMLILAMLFIISNMALAYLPSKMVGNFFFLLFNWASWITYPMVILMFIWIFAGIWRDKEVKRMLERGVDIKSTP